MIVGDWWYCFISKRWRYIMTMMVKIADTIYGMFNYYVILIWCQFIFIARAMIVVATADLNWYYDWIGRHSF